MMPILEWPFLVWHPGDRVTVCPLMLLWASYAVRGQVHNRSCHLLGKSELWAAILPSVTCHPSSSKCYEFILMILLLTLTLKMILLLEMNHPSHWLSMGMRLAFLPNTFTFVLIVSNISTYSFVLLVSNISTYCAKTWCTAIIMYPPGSPPPKVLHRFCNLHSRAVPDPQIKGVH